MAYIVFSSIFALVAIAIAVVPVTVILFQDSKRDRQSTHLATVNTLIPASTSPHHRAAA